jgi:hypothetical protein
MKKIYIVSMYESKDNSDSILGAFTSKRRAFKAAKKSLKEIAQRHLDWNAMSMNVSLLVDAFYPDRDRPSEHVAKLTQKLRKLTDHYERVVFDSFQEQERQ